MSSKKVITVTLVASPNQPKLMSRKEFEAKQAVERKQLNDRLEQLKTPLEALSLENDHNHDLELPSSTVALEDHETYQGLSVEEMFRVLLQQMIRLNQKVGTLDQKFGTLDQKVGTLTEICSSTESKVTGLQSRLWEGDIRRVQMEARQNNRVYPNDMWEVPNISGEYPSDRNEFSEIAPIVSSVQLSNFDNKGELLNRFLDFYHIPKGRRGYHRTGSILQRKMLLAKELGIDLHLLSVSAVQYE